MKTLLVLGLGLAAAVASRPAAAQAPAAARAVEPVVMTGSLLPDWSRAAAQIVCAPYPSGALTGPRDAHNGTDVVPPDPRPGAPVDEIVAYRWDGLQFVEIPVQVDQRFYNCLSNPASDFGVYSGTDKELTYEWDVESWKKLDGVCTAQYPAGVGPTPDPVPTLDDDDEIVVMASDAGPQAPTGALAPLGASEGHGVALVDPLDASTLRFVYLFRKAGGSSFDASNGYVSYVRDANADEWIDQCSFRDDDPEKLGTSNTGYGPNLSGTVCRTAVDPGRCPAVADGTPRPSDDRFVRDGVTVTTDSYRWRASGRWMVRGIQVAKPGQPGVYGLDLIDRWKGRAFQQSPDSSISLVGFEDEQVNWEANDALLGERRGPVRAIREAWGADSGTNVTKTESFYRDVITYRYHVRVHPIPPDGLYTSWDYNDGVATTYYNVIKTDGVAIDGVNDDVGSVDGVFGQPAYFDAPDPTFNVPSAQLNWEQVSGAGDAGSLVYIVEMKGATSAENPAVVPYYRDDACLDDGTGDDPVQRPWPGEASTDTRVLNGYCAAAGKPNGCHVCRDAADLGPCDVDCKLHQTQGAFGAHGVHYFFSSDTDNAASPEVLTEIDAQQWQFTVPTAQPTNVGQTYGNVVIAPLQKVAVPLTTLPLPTTTTTTVGGTTSTTAGGGTTTTSFTLPTLPTTTSTTLPNLTPPSAADGSVVTEQDTAADATLSGADLLDCELTFAIVTAPAHGTLGAISARACAPGLPSNDTAVVPYTPAAGFHGTDSFTYRVSDGTSDSAPATVTVTVKQAAPPTCATGPVTGCRQPVRSQVGKLSLRNRSPDAGDQMVWKWTYGAATSMQDYGTPGTTTNYQLCVYDGAGRTLARAAAPPGGDCGGRPCWKQSSAQFTYRSRDRVPGGGRRSTVRLRLRAGTNGKARIIAQGNGTALGLG
ncbi:MAG TPA: Ig-like domain-containing protein, partial [Candidatus Binatia bacterium]|nr:Ig-like domain-containing protein [Candidatus Binatia bacterium]